jgi:hypothetical protein
VQNYSGKIANIMNIIQNSEGIVLIYSKYIEGGLVPVALALEELGFSRYGDANYTKSLFKTAPTQTTMPYGLNPVTMQPNIEPGNYTAKYVMITGTKYYSPNNTADLKLVTDISNKNGEHIRVILISEAGSEGLDFKNIRQVHILEPWYNMNRKEQVIGRAVRHKSHCALPLEKRNVEIYMHGSYLNDEEEMADMYVYRLAEKKAFQIGEVTRVLKETAVDCLLNIDQTNFTEEKMNQTISLHLSSKKIIDYKVGDKPFSYNCDYMENCVFSCNNTKTLEDENPVKKQEIQWSTYNESFLQSNHTRISKRIRQLFREKSFFTLDDLLQEISIIKPFPLENIYYTISLFLKNKDWLVDKKGQKGYMIRKEDIYAFQPLEITDTEASIFERKAPLDYKRPSLPIQLPEDFILNSTKTKAPVPQETRTKQRLKELESTLSVSLLAKSPKNSDSDVSPEYSALFSLLEKKMDFILNQSSFIKPEKSERDWYVYAKLAYRICKEKHGIEASRLLKYCIHHFIDMLMIEDKMIFLQELIPNATILDKREEWKLNPTTENIIRSYFFERIFSTKRKIYILLNLLQTKTENRIYSIDIGTGNNKKKWKEDVQTQENTDWIVSFNQREELLELLTEYFKKNQNPKEKEKKEINIGFIGHLKEKIFGFKIMNINNDRTRPNPGALCEQADKKKTIHKINDLLFFMDNYK